MKVTESQLRKLILKEINELGSSIDVDASVSEAIETIAEALVKRYEAAHQDSYPKNYDVRDTIIGIVRNHVHDAERQVDEFVKYHQPEEFALEEGLLDKFRSKSSDDSVIEKPEFRAACHAFKTSSNKAERAAAREKVFALAGSQEAGIKAYEQYCKRNSL